MRAAFGLYTHIQSNRRRSIALLLGLFALIHLLVFAGGLVFRGMTDTQDGLRTLVAGAADFTLRSSPFVALGVGLWLLLAWRFHQALIDAVTDGRAVTRGEAGDLYNLLENLCISRGLAMPTLRIVESGALNAFATGMNPRQYSISVTRGLLDALEPDELEAVLAHELTHIRNGDVRLMVIATVVAGIVSFVAEMAFRGLMRGPRVALPRRSRDPSGGKRGGSVLAAVAIGMLLIAIAWFLSLALRFALSRSREFLADAGAVELTRNPDAMISALQKIAGRAEIPGVPSGVMEMCIENRKAGIADLFASHPPIEERIRVLIEFAGERPPEAPRAVGVGRFQRPSDETGGERLL